MKKQKLYKCDICGKKGNYLEFDNENSENFDDGIGCLCRDCAEGIIIPIYYSFNSRGKTIINIDEIKEELENKLKEILSKNNKTNKKL